MNTQAAVEIAHLRKTYGGVVAVDDVSFSVAEGEIFGVLGPNGAGKTTTVECVLGLRSPDAGSIRVMGLDPGQDREDLHLIVGAQLQESAQPAKLRVGEILDLYRSFYTEPADVGEFIDALGLAGKLKDYYRSLSGGQRQRLSIALALIGQPKIAVLDEMTTGLDPQARRDTWDLIEGVRDRGVTILLVTHFMEEAERLCDRVALIDAGRVVALDSPAGLAARASGGKTMRFVPSAHFDYASAPVLGASRASRYQFLHRHDLAAHRYRRGRGGLRARRAQKPRRAGAVDRAVHRRAVRRRVVDRGGRPKRDRRPRHRCRRVLPSAVLRWHVAAASNDARHPPGDQQLHPLGAAAEAMQDSMQGQFPPAAPLLVLAGYALVFAFIARRYFRWE